MKRAGKPADLIFNILTVVVLGLTVVSCLCIGSIFINPMGVFSFLGPATFPAPLTVPTLASADATATPLIYPTLPPEWTATITPTLTEEPPTGTPTTTQDASAPTNGSRTPFPSSVGPTATLTPTDQPTATATVPTPTRTATLGPYPGDIPTRTPIPPTPYP